MSDVAVRVDNLGKRYRIGRRERYRMLREALAAGFSAASRKLRGRGDRSSNGDSPRPAAVSPAENYNPQAEFIWALKNVSFEIKRGDVVGIIGRNAAGKSTLLKILSRITEPTEGEATIYGRVGSLLEVGTGFHPELTGRENVYLNGAILGMKKVEIGRKFDEIVAFAEVETFLDTPVKHYSSGMYMRLAFSVSAHLEPEILIVDEILAVGDAAFQKKCLGKMSEVAKEGRTVLFVSHNMSAIERLCARVITLAKGGIVYKGAPGEAVEAYLASLHISGSVLKQGIGKFDLTGAPRGGKRAQASTRAFQALSIYDSKGRPRDVVACGEDVVIAIRYRSDSVIARPTVGIVISSDSHGPLAFIQTRIQHKEIDMLPPEGEVRCTIPRLPLVPGRYTLSLGLTSDGKQVDWIEDQIELRVEPADFFSTGNLPPATHGPLLMDARWDLPSR